METPEACGRDPLGPGLTLHDLADDLAGLIRELGDRPAALLGHAFGSRVVRCLAPCRMR